jgi:hypothetical protein
MRLPLLTSMLSDALDSTGLPKAKSLNIVCSLCNLARNLERFDGLSRQDNKAERRGGNMQGFMVLPTEHRGQKILQGNKPSTNQAESRWYYLENDCRLVTLPSCKLWSLSRIYIYILISYETAPCENLPAVFTILIDLNLRDGLWLQSTADNR